MNVRALCERLPRAGLLAGLGAAAAILAVPGHAPLRAEPAPDQPTAQLLEGPASTFGVLNRARRLQAKGMTAGSPVMIRIFKGESELELWLKKGERFELFATYPVCYWSGRLGPKQREGDRQAPEGFYTVSTEQLHRQGRHPRSLDLGFPNALDRAQSRTGSYILMHGGCRSIGCYAMTNPIMEEVYALSEQALRQGQDRIQVHVFPFRMTDANLSVFADHKWHDFWLGLREAYDLFEQTHTPPRIAICDKQVCRRSGAGPGRSRRASFPRNGHVGRPQHLRAGRGGGARAGLAARAHRHPPLRALHAPRAPLRRPQCPPRLRGGPPLARCRLRPAHAHHLGQLLASRPLRSTGPPLPSPAATPSDNQPSIALAERP